MPRFVSALLIVLVVACASSPPNPHRPAVRVFQLNRMSFGATTQAIVTVDVEIKNVASRPLTVRMVRLESGLTQQYVFTAVQRAVRETIPPGETRNVRLAVTATSQQGRISDPEPLNLRGFVTYLVEEKQFQDLYIFRAILQ